MKIGIFSDIHANINGLQSLIKSVESNKTDTLISYCVREP